MADPVQHSMLCSTIRGCMSRFELWLIVALTLFATAAHAQSYTILSNFTGQAAGALPYDAVTMDVAGNLYGTASHGGSGIGQSGNGTVFRLSRSGSGWVFTLLYTFQGGSDGAVPESGVVFGPDGALYGTTTAGGGNGCGENGCGTVFKLTPPTGVCKAASCPWSEVLLYRFVGAPDGAFPAYGNLVFDQAGAIYGTTAYGGSSGYGTVYKLTNSGGTWTESVLYAFTGGPQAYPFAGLVADELGNFFGTTFGYGYGQGSVYELSSSGSGWIYQTLSTFSGQGEGAQPTGGVSIDQYGNLYGTTTGGGPYGGGMVYELMPSQGNWTFVLLQGLQFYAIAWDTPTLDNEGNIYGTAAFTGGPGEVFELRRSGGGWSFRILHTFTGSDGYLPFGSVTVDSNGNLYGTTYSGGSGGGGVIWELSP